jgi:hypothetical protein
MRPLNDYYHVRLLEMPKKPGLLLSIETEDSKQIRLAQIVSTPKDNELELQPNSFVYVQQFYGQKIGEDMLIKQDYIIAEYTEK